MPFWLGGPNVEPEVVGALETKVGFAEALLCLARGSLRRVTGATAMNAESLRVRDNCGWWTKIESVIFSEQHLKGKKPQTNTLLGWWRRSSMFTLPPQG